MLQKKYFKLDKLDNSLPIFAFVGRITQQKGVHLILENLETIIKKFNGKVQVTFFSNRLLFRLIWSSSSLSEVWRI